MTILSSSSLLRSRLAELRGYALLGFCMLLTAGFVSEIWPTSARAGQAVGLSSEPVAPCQVASAR
jgi:hypothetical protein